jgi:hypothetical protein
MAGLVCMLLVGLGQTPAHAQEAQKFLLQGDVALWTVAIKADKTAEFEQVLGKLRTALQTSDKPERQQQGKNWKVLRLKTPLPDGNVAYVHMVSSPVPDADYTVMKILYEAFPDEARTIYDMYKEAFVANLSLASGTVVMEVGKTP